MKSFSPKALQPTGPAKNSARNETDKVADYGQPQPISGVEWSFRNVGVGGALPPVSAAALSQPALQRKLVVNEPGDQYEQEADRVAEQVMRMPEPGVPQAKSSLHAAPVVQRKCAQCEEEEKLQRKCAKCEEEEKLQRKETGTVSETNLAPPIVHEVLKSPGQPLDSATRAFFEPRFGYDFSRVHVHVDAKAAESAAIIDARAYTTGSQIVFGADQLSPRSSEGQRLLAHELTHVIQQSRLGATVQRQGVTGVPSGLDPGTAGDIEAEREYGKSGAPKAQNCGSPSGCPPAFCEPYKSEKLAEYYRAKQSWWIMLGISKFVDSRVVPLWKEYLWGGSAPKDLTSDFGKDFTNSPTTKKTTEFLRIEIEKSIRGKPPNVSNHSRVAINLNGIIGPTLARLDDPVDPKRMNFNIPKDIPGNIAGDIGKDQIACPAGAKPSPFNDERHADGTVIIERKASADLFITPKITYRVKDTIDLCPGDCGTLLEQIATVPLSKFEATGISGDVPFTVEFPAPDLGPLTVSVPGVPSSSLPNKAPPVKKP